MPHTGKVLDAFGWITYDVTAMRIVWHSVATTDGEFITVNTRRTCPSNAK